MLLHRFYITNDIICHKISAFQPPRCKYAIICDTISDYFNTNILDVICLLTIPRDRAWNDAKDADVYRPYRPFASHSKQEV